jgi:UDP-3-O-[3-hydroxymyristoyl] N-acetylglucosamine deacetylase/3-hydroxyacyl-[acyl-carrier-protein] dehydratase
VVSNAPPSPGARPQRTLKSPVEYRGIGLHSGKDIRIVVRPAEAGTGVTFVRTDIEDHPVVRAHGANMKARQRRTCIQDGRAEVYTCEHLLAALYALGIDNAMVEIDGEEVPGLDGAASEFFRGLRESGSVEMRATRQIYAVKQPIYVREGTASLVALPGSGRLTIEYHLDYPSQKKNGEPNGSLPGAKQIVGFEMTPDNFEREIAPARTFVFSHEVEALRAAGLGKGATPQNTLVVGPNGPEANALRWDDELARHKILDLIGDLANAGCDLDAHIIATRSGHGLNMALVQRILEEREREQEEGEAPSDSGLDIRQIQLEAMAQLAGVLLLRKLENTGKLAVLWSIDKVKLRGAVVPGDQLRIEVETIRAKPQVGHVRARCKVAGRLVAEAELKFTLVDA